MKLVEYMLLQIPQWNRRLFEKPLRLIVYVMNEVLCIECFTFLNVLLRLGIWSFRKS